MRTVMKILVPIDFTAPSDVALMYGRHLAKVFGADLHVLHVMENQFLRVTFKSASAVETGMVRRVAEQLTDDDRASLHAVTVVRMSNAPADEILQYAKEENIDLVVLATHGGSNVAHLIMGSVAEQVIRTAPCAVLTIHQPEREFVIPNHLHASHDFA